MAETRQAKAMRVFSPCGLDKLRMYIGPSDHFTPPFQKLRKHARRSAQLLEDYREYSLPVVLKPPQHWYRRNAPHVLDFTCVGELTADDIVNALAEIVAGDPLKLRLGLLDFTADWHGGTVSLCRRNFRIRGKHRYAEWGNVETLVYGSPKSGDFYRVYDKAAELRKRGDLGPPTPWTRIERRLSGRSLPSELRTLGGLLANGASFEPFRAVSSIEIGDVDPAWLFENWPSTWKNRQRALTTLTLLNAFGEMRTRRILAAEGRKPHLEFALARRASAEVAPPEMPNLNALYRAGFMRQLWPHSVDSERPQPITSLQPRRIAVPTH